MDGHFRTFSFVDQITAAVPGAGIRGRFTVPARVQSFPVALVAEAVGQLAAWSAMAAVGFTHRPVAGIAGQVKLISSVRPGQVLELEAELESLDTESVGYCGSAYADGVQVAHLLDCVGPMLPTEDFDDPKALRERFTLLSTGGAPAGVFDGVPALDLEPDGREESRSLRTVLHIPKDAGFFEDHFPRRPVFPGTLLMHANLQTAAQLAAEVPAKNGAAWRPRIVSDVKLRTFISPGETLILETKRTAHSETSLEMRVESRIGQRLISSAEIEFVSEVKP